MTTAQSATLRIDIQSRANLYAGGKPLLSDVDIAAFYNLPAVPALNIWRPVVTVGELSAAIAWAAMAAISQEKQLTFQTMIWANAIDMTDAQVRNGIAAVFTAGSASEVAILAMGQRPATYLEALFATGGGATKVSKVFFGAILQPQDVTNALSV